MTHRKTITDPRKLKRRVNNITKKISKYGFFIDCNYHPCVVTRINKCTQDPYSADISGVSLITNSGTSCSCLHCGPEPLTKEKAVEMATVYRQEGFKSYGKKYLGYTEADCDYLDTLAKDVQAGFNKISPQSITQIISEHFV